MTRRSSSKLVEIEINLLKGDESKRASIVTEGGDKGKLESFVNFCEDAIFEIQHASSISMEDEEETPTCATAYPFPGSDEGPP
ncbi:ryanodine receptor [Trichonephila clavipes]|nr:ryanodine receptor [Trichonephila clavipes]